MNDDPQTSSRRLEAVRLRARSDGVDLLVLTPGDDLTYLLGTPLHSHERLTALVLPTGPDTRDRPSEPTLVLPRVEDGPGARAAAGRIDARVEVWADGDDPVATVAGLVDGGERVAVSADMPARHLLPLRDRIGGPVRSAADVIDVVRAVKEPFERTALADAARRIDEVHGRMAEFLVVGRTEAEVARLIDEAIVAVGLTHTEFVIVGSGPNGADPHHGASDRVIGTGDVVVVDMGGPVAEGYHSDCTRTYVMGEPSGEVSEAYAHLADAQRRARETVRPGVPVGEVDAAARDHLDSVGLGEAFIHRTGHGIGLGLHEPPSVVAGADTVLEEGMTFSVEPGIYFPGRWGARLEDIVEVTSDGVRSLNGCSRELRQL